MNRRTTTDIEALFARPVARRDDAALVTRVLERSVRRDRRRVAVLGIAALLGTLASVVALTLLAASGAVPEALSAASESASAVAGRLPMGAWREWAVMALAGAAGLGAVGAAGSRAWRAD